MRWAFLALCFFLDASLSAGAQTFDYEQQIAASEARLAKARQAHIERDEANELIRLGELQAHAGQAKVALGTEKTALDICTRLKLFGGGGGAVQDIGWIYSLLEDKKHAVEFYNMGLKIEEATSNFNSEANTLDNLGNLSFDAGQPAIAFDYYNRALKIARDHSNRLGEAQILRNIGVDQMVLGNFQDAVNSLELVA
jgi:tetratricopeptide (TPR) repeat protein